MSRFDRAYRKLILSKFFTKGWGAPENMQKIFQFQKKLASREECQKLLPANCPLHIDKESISGNVRIIDGHFKSPLLHHLPEIMPRAIHKANFQMILPVQWNSQLRPICIHLAGTGDHYFRRRRILMAKPLLEESGIASILLENPYYGSRKPSAQLRSALLEVTDLFIMGSCLILESLVLLRWCEARGYWPAGLTGVSMGGHMASLAATNWHRPLPLIPCLSWSTASSVFTQGVLSSAVDWKTLHHQYHTDKAYKHDIERMLITSQCVNNGSTSFDARWHHLSRCSSYSARTVDEDDVGQQQPVLMSSAAGPDPGHSAAGSSGCEACAGADTQLTADPAQHFMRAVMDECTHLANFSTPLDDRLITVVTARLDAYVPRQHVTSLRHIWPRATFTDLNKGHINAFLFSQAFFRDCIRDAFNRTIEMYSTTRERITVRDSNSRRIVAIKTGEYRQRV